MSAELDFSIYFELYASDFNYFMAIFLLQNTLGINGNKKLNETIKIETHKIQIKLENREGMHETERNMFFESFNRWNMTTDATQEKS